MKQSLQKKPPCFWIHLSLSSLLLVRPSDPRCSLTLLRVGLSFLLMTTQAQRSQNFCVQSESPFLFLPGCKGGWKISFLPPFFPFLSLCWVSKQVLKHDKQAPCLPRSSTSGMTEFLKCSQVLLGIITSLLTDY